MSADIPQCCCSGVRFLYLLDTLFLKILQERPQCQEVFQFKAGWWQSEGGYFLLSSKVGHQDGKNERKDEGKHWIFLLWVWCAMCPACLLRVQKYSQKSSQPWNKKLRGTLRLSLPITQCHKPTPGWKAELWALHKQRDLETSGIFFPFFPIFFYKILQVVESGGDEKWCLQTFLCVLIKPEY